MLWHFLQGHWIQQWPLCCFCTQQCYCHQELAAQAQTYPSLTTGAATPKNGHAISSGGGEGQLGDLRGKGDLNPFPTHSGSCWTCASDLASTNPRRNWVRRLQERVIGSGMCHLHGIHSFLYPPCLHYDPSLHSFASSWFLLNVSSTQHFSYWPIYNSRQEESWWCGREGLSLPASFSSRFRS